MAEDGSWWEGPGPDQDFTLKVERTARPPLSWTWEIARGAGKGGARRSPRAYRSAEDAWAAGRAVLAGLRRRYDPAR
jgi:hypothetical protein